MDNAEILIKFKGDATEAEKATEDVQKNLDDLSKKGEVAFLGLTAAADAFAVSVLKGGINYNAEIETYMTRLETLTGSAENAEAVMSQIKQDALKTPFDVSSLTQAESLLLSTGLSADESRADILALGDAIAASGGGNAELQRMAVNLQQIKNVGKASSLDIKQFAYAGIDIYGLLADSMGITREEASKLDVTYGILSNALQQASSEGGKYYGAMEKQSQTYNGQMSNLKESIEVLKGELSKGLFNAFKKIIPQLTKFFNWVGKNQKVIKAIAVPLLTFANVLGAILIAKKVTTAIKALWLVFSANPIGVVIAAIAALVAGFIYLWNNCEDFRKFWIGLWESIKKIVKTVIDAIIKVIKTIIDVVIDIFNKIKDIFTPLIEFYEWLLLGIVAIVTNIIDMIIKIVLPIVQWVWNTILKPIIDFFSNAFNTIWNVVKTIFDGIKNTIKTVFNFIKDNIISPLVNFFSGIFGSIYDTIKSAFQKAYDFIKGLFEGIIDILKAPFNLLIDGVNTVIGALNKISIKVPKWVPKIGGKTWGFNIKKIPKLNVGTNYVPEDTLAMIHEGEAVVPKKFNPYAGGIMPNTLGMMNRTQPVIIVNANFKQNSLGQTVRDIKTFSGGARNDFNYGVGV